MLPGKVRAPISESLSAEAVNMGDHEGIERSGDRPEHELVHAEAQDRKTPPTPRDITVYELTPPATPIQNVA